jgi:hypothetical protein
MSEHLDRRLEALAYHAPSGSVQAVMTELRLSGQVLVSFLDGQIPECREKSLAFTALEEAMMWAMKALALTDPGRKVVSP